ncbi:MAG: HAD family hydrolase [Planctomycetaceae bacterium]
MRRIQEPVNDTSDQLPTIAGVALDMDGLLFDTESLYWQVGQTVLGRRGHQFTRILQQRMMGRVGVMALQQMVEHHGLSDTAELLLAESDEIYAELIVAGVPTMPGLDRLIEALRRSGLPFGVATSSQRKFAERILGPMPWYSDLQFVLTGDDVIHGKPHPEIYQRAAYAIAIDPAQMLVLEDSGNGSASGVAAGAVVVSVPNECTHDHSFEGVYGIATGLDDPLILDLLGPGLRP